MVRTGAERPTPVASSSKEKPPGGSAMPRAASGASTSRGSPNPFFSHSYVSCSAATRGAPAALYPRKLSSFLPTFR